MSHRKHLGEAAPLNRRFKTPSGSRESTGGNLILAANGSGGNQEGLASVLLQECLCNSHRTQPCLKLGKQHLELLGVDLPLHSAALSSNSCSFSLISPKKASVSTEEPGEGSLRRTKTHTQGYHPPRQMYCSDETDTIKAAASRVCRALFKPSHKGQQSVENK